MKITCMSDTHGMHDRVNVEQLLDSDILIHAGDFTARGTDYEVVDFLTWYSKIEVPYKILVAGNHDFYATTEEFKELLKSFPAIIYLENSSVTIGDLNIWGSPYSNLFRHWAFMKEDKYLKEIWDKIPQNTNIVVTHGPAYGTGDKVRDPYSGDPRVGSVSLKNRLDELPELRAHIIGHVHEGYGRYKNRYTTINSSICTNKYLPYNDPISIDTKALKRNYNKNRTETLKTR